MFNNEKFDFGGNGGNLQKKLLDNLKYTRFFFLFGVWAGYIILLFLFAVLITYLLNNISFVSGIIIGDIIKIYCIAILTFFGIKLFPLR